MYERRVTTAGITHVYMITGPSGVIAQEVWSDGAATPTSTLYLHSDAQGSIDTVTDATGAVVSRQKFDPYGAEVEEWDAGAAPTGSGPAAGPFASRINVGYTGHESDRELNLINMKGRIYDPRTMRFLTPDPLWSAYPGATMGPWPPPIPGDGGGP